MLRLVRRLFRKSPALPSASTGRNAPPPGWALIDRHIEVEREQIRRHRMAVHVDPGTDLRDIPGLAISGGGIRSAVFSLGVLQFLADENRLRDFSYISTVSGGSYLGAFYGSLFIPDEMRQGAQKVPPERFVETARCASDRVRPKTLADDQDAVTPIEYLRNNCNYLVPNGLDDVLQSIAFSGRNWFALQYVIGVSILAIILWLDLVEVHLLRFLEDYRLPLPPVLPLPGVNSGPCELDVGWMFPAFLGVATLLFVMSPLSRAYWLTQNLAQDLRRSLKALPALSLLLVGCLAFGTIEAIRYHYYDSGFLNDPQWSSTERFFVGWAWMIILLQILSLLYLLLAWSFTRRDKQTGKRWFHGAVSNTVRGSDSRPFVDRVRNALTNAYTTPPSIRSHSFLSGPTQLVLWLFAIALIDFGGGYAAALLRSLEGGRAQGGGIVATTVFATGVVWTVGRFLLAKGDAVEKAYKRIPKIILASGAAVVASVATLLIWSTFAHIVGCGFVTYGFSLRFLGRWGDSTTLSIVVCVVVLLIAILDGLCIQFLNLSTYQRLYSTRLTRTFLGATNRARLDASDQRDVTSLVSGDSISMGQYFHRDSCAPVHLINATINKTVDWNSALVHRGARGLSMCIGPAGISIGAMLGVLSCDWQAANDISTPATHERDGDKTPGIWLESLTLGDWIAISGAAVSTGLGRMTRSGYSLLLGIMNIRLGYWWDTYSAPFRDGAQDFKRERVPLPSRESSPHVLRDGLFGTQFCLLDELLGQFDGPRARRWYLTDGGHFENTGAYELLRRGLKFIVLLDNGADRDFEFDDAATLMRLARVDFGIDIQTDEDVPVWQPDNIDIDFTFVALSFHRFLERPVFIAVRLLTIFPDGSKGQIILVKPRLTTLAPYDVWEYKKKRDDFPHETTANQFFNDVQWESHRALGESQARSLFSRKARQEVVRKGAKAS